MAPPLKSIKLVGLFLLSIGVTTGLLQFLDMGCSELQCGIHGYHYGLRLFLGFVFLAFIGQLFFSSPFAKSDPQDFRLFTSIATGLAILMAYVYTRSLFSHLLFDVPITRFEVFGVLIFSYLISKHKKRKAVKSEINAPATRIFYLIAALGILLALCIAIADRELPRAMLLSSDPDQHSFWGRQIQRFGGVPYQQRDWGTQSFNYPAGSGVLLFCMWLLGGLDPRNSLVTLPILFTFFAAMIIVENFNGKIRKIEFQITLQFAAVALMAGGLMFPLYSPYAHGEGSGRLLSILFVGLLFAILAKELNAKDTPSFKYLIWSSLALFPLIVLNPANVMMPAVLLGAMIVHGWLNNKPKSILILGTMVGALLLAFLDPYYQHLLGIGRGVAADSLVLNERFTLLRPYGVAMAAIQYYLNEGPTFFQNITALLTEESPPLFALMLMIYGAGLLTSSPTLKFPTKPAITSVAFIIILYLVYGFSFAFAKDQRFYLLGPYFYFSIAQYKAIFLVFLMTLTIKMAMSAEMPFWKIILLAIMLVWPPTIFIRNSQDMYLGPRRDFCGSLGCFPNDDKMLLNNFEVMTRSGHFQNTDGSTPKVLIPNALSTTDIESWIFPVSSARVLPHYDVLPAAFYYYQGDTGYGTISYEKHVCKTFDRAWLLSRDIQYIYLPTERKDTCMAGMEGLIQTEKVVLQQGNAYLLKLNP